jgi:hypothetical protein
LEEQAQDYDIGAEINMAYDIADQARTKRHSKKYED